MRKIKIALALVLICTLSFMIVACTDDNTDYTVKFETNGGSEIADITVSSENPTLALPANPTKTGFIFENWYFDNETFAEKVTVEDILAKLSSDVHTLTVYANWTAVDASNTYIVNFNSNGGSDVAVIYVSKTNPSLTLPSAPTKTEATFVGWYFDNGTFNQAATSAAILEKLSESSTSITVYAKWLSEFSNAADALATSLSSLYDGITYVPETPSEETLARFAELAELLALSEDYTLEENYNNIDIYLYAINQYNRYIRYIALIDSLEAEPYPGQLSADEIAELTDIAKTYDLQGETVYDNYTTIQSWLNGDGSIYAEVSIDEINLKTEYRDNAGNIISYNEYVDAKTEFEDMVNEFLSTLSSADIRTAKVNNLAAFISSYDYSTLMFENDYGDYNTNPVKMLDFLFEAIDAGELTDEDVGALLYRFINLSLDNLIEEIDEYDIVLNEIIADTENYDSDFRDNMSAILIANAEKKTACLEIEAQLSLALVTDYASLIIGVADIVNTSNVIDSIFDISNLTTVLTIAEIATVLASVKSTCDNLIADYSETEWSAMVAATDTFLTLIEDLDNNYSKIATFIKDNLSDNPTLVLEQVSNVLALFTTDNLDVFLTVTEDTVSPDFDNEYFMDNLVILEAKIITTLVGETYDEAAFAAAYDSFLGGIVNVFPALINISLGDSSSNSGSLSYTALAYKYLADMLFDEFEDKIVITQSGYDAIKTIAAMDFVTEGTTTVTEAMYSDVVIMDIYNTVMDYANIMSGIADSLDNLYLSEDEIANGPSEIEFKNLIAAAVILYTLDIDYTKLESYKAYIDTLLAVENFSQTSDPMLLFAYIINGLYEAQFTDAEITNILIKFSDYLADYGLEAYNLSLEDNEIISDFVTAINTSSDTTIDTLSTFIVNVLRISSQAYIEIYETIITDFATDFDLIAPIIKDALLELKSLYTATEENQTINTEINTLISDIFEVLKELIIEIAGNDDATVSEFYNTAYDVICAFMSVKEYDFDATIDKLIAIVDEFDTANITDTSTLSDDMMIFLCKSAVLVIGTDPLNNMSSVFTIAGDSNIGIILDAIFNADTGIYDEILTISAYDYGTADSNFATTKTAITDFFEDLFTGSDEEEENPVV